MTTPSISPAPRNHSVLSVDAATANALLLQLARTLRDNVLPSLEGRPHSAAQDCITIAIRLAQQLACDDSEAAPLLPNAQQKCGESGWARAAAAEGKALDLSEAQALQLVASLAEPAPSVRTADSGAIEAYLRQHQLGGPKLKVTAARSLAGGRSKQTILVTQQGAIDLPETLIVRQDWLATRQEWAKAATSAVVTEFEVLKRVHAAGMRVPRPLLVESSPEPLGAPFLVVTAMPGKLEGDLFFPPKSRALALQVAEQLGLLHRLNPQGLAENAGLQTKDHSHAEMRADLATWRGVVAQLDAPCHTVAIALDWLEANLPANPGTAGLVHGDMGFHNMLAEGETLTAVLDWERVRLGAPAQDLGYVRTAIEKMISWEDFIGAYRAAGGPAFDPSVVDFYTVWSSMWLYATLLQARAGLVAGMLRDSEVAVFCVHFLPVLRQRLSIELRNILDRQFALAT